MSKSHRIEVPQSDRAAWIPEEMTCASGKGNFDTDSLADGLNVVPKLPLE